MKVAIVRASDLVREGRWDAGFHIALSELQETIEVLRGRYTEDEAVALLAKVPLSDKGALDVLRIGSRRRSMGREEAEEVARRYPHLALALVAREADTAVRRIREEIVRSQDALARLIELSEKRTARLEDIAAGIRPN